MKTASTNKKIRELINLVKDGKLIDRPEFQRRLVWTNKDKDHFIDSILRGYPFPEIYLADGDVNLESGEGTQLLVDGLQRVHTLVEYFEASSALKLLTVTPYKELKEEAKKAFLQYDVAVRDLGSVEREEIVEVFRRINATKYSLLDIEVNNAVYGGALKQYAERLASNDFFLNNNIFNAQDFKRMGDLRYALTLVITFISGYFNRDDVIGELLDRYNDDFPLAEEITDRLQKCFDLITECGFDPRSRIWKKADLFTIIVELDTYSRAGNSLPQPSDLLDKLNNFYSRTESQDQIPTLYYKSALQATNDKGSRLRRGVIIGGILKGLNDSEIMGEIVREGFN